MAQVHQHPDGLIYIRADGRVYMETTENFVLDHGAKAPPLPVGVVERIYDDTPEGPRHALLDAKGNHIASGEIPWIAGDRIIADIDAILIAQTQRQRITPEPIIEPPTPQQQVTGNPSSRATIAS